MSGWMKENGYPIPFNYRKRPLLYEQVAKYVNEPMIYLEFGVSKGTSFRKWLKLLPNSKSRFYGFNTFTGLPQDWGNTPKGAFSTHGLIPLVHDARAEFIVGLVEETLPRFQIPEGFETLLVNIDTDLPEPAQFILEWLLDHLVPSMVIMFDEFASLDQGEAIAFKTFCKKSGTKWQPIGRTTSWSRVAFIRI